MRQQYIRSAAIYALLRADLLLHAQTMRPEKMATVQSLCESAVERTSASIRYYFLSALRKSFRASGQEVVSLGLGSLNRVNITMTRKC